MKTFPSLRAGICTIGPLRFPAIVGEVKGETSELFVCGLHIDRFVAEKTDAGAIDPFWPVRVDAAVRGREL